MSNDYVERLESEIEHCSKLYHRLVEQSDMSTDMIKQLQKERDELAAHCERLRNALVICHNAHEDYYIEQPNVCSAIKETPSCSLAHIRADAISEVFREMDRAGGDSRKAMGVVASSWLKDRERIIRNGG